MQISLYTGLCGITKNFFSVYFLNDTLVLPRVYNVLGRVSNYAMAYEK